MDGQQRFGRGNAWPYELRSRERLTHRFDRVFAPLPWRADDSYWLTPETGATRSENLFASRPLSGLPFGQYALTMFVNGISSEACVISLRESVPADHLFRDGFDSDLNCN